MFLSVYCLGSMGLKPEELITDTGGRDSPASVEVHKDSNVVPQSAPIPQAAPISQSAPISRKRKYRSVSSRLQSPTSSASSVADVDIVTAGAAVTASSQPTAAVVASIHSYAMPSCIRRPAKLTARHTAIGSTASCEDDNSTSKSDSNTVDALKRPVSLYHPRV